VTTKRRKLIALVLLAVVGGVIAYFLPRRSDEPEYKGRRLSEWLETYQNNLGDELGRHVEAQVAIQNIGTNALPCLLKWIDYEPPRWRVTIRKILPTFILNRRPVNRWLDGEASRRAVAATDAFLLLGTNAASAVPELHALMKNNGRPGSSDRAIYALGCVGDLALPSLKAGLADPNQLNRLSIVYNYRYMADKYGTNNYLPVLIDALKHEDISVRKTATNALRGLVPSDLTGLSQQ
jgi:hypothetical protein